MAEAEQRTCQFYLVRKKRNCKFAAHRDTPYCAEHSHVLNDATGRKRIACPRDGKHTCYEDELTDHLKHCNVTKRGQRLANLDYFAADYNLPCDLRRSSTDTKADHGSIDNEVQQWRELQTQRLLHFSPEEIMCFIKDLEAIYNDKQYCKYFRINQVPHRTSDFSASASTDTIAKSKFMKEQAQRKCIYDTLKARDIFETDTNETVFVELGAGRGGLTEHFCKQLCEERSKADLVRPKAHFVLVERSPARNKLENKLKRRQEQDNTSQLQSSTVVMVKNPDADSNSSRSRTDSELLSDAESKYNVLASRIRLDIKDLKLSRLPPLVDNGNAHVHFLAKHLCGSATDLIINCIVNYVASGAKRPHSLCLALCCHHRCDYAMLSPPARNAWHKLGLTVRHFRLATLISAWATCGFQKSDADVGTTQTGDESTQVDNAVVQLSSSEKERVGFVAKRVIDLACRLIPLSTSLDSSYTTGSDTCSGGDCANDRSTASSVFNNVNLFDEVYLCDYIDNGTTPENVLLVAINLQR